ncbi:MAG TPA: S1/P1 nuclease [Gammaproteobacteria bacterium]|nr:S1/P1 nuclease [Gammaproteobacteria bacterium]
MRAIEHFAFCGLALVSGLAQAYGFEGHLIAGDLAQPLLCRPAADEIASLTKGENLGEIGLWADKARDQAKWKHTGPWHYMNIADGADVSRFEHPPEGDVLWAIEHYTAQLSAARSRKARLEALRFVVHFIVDVHQPLHVGRASDRGGNTIDVRYGTTTVNLHHFWDTDVLHVAGLSRAQYEAALEPTAAMLSRQRERSSPADWAAESMALRPRIYDFVRPRHGPAVLDRRYLERADRITRFRLAQAAVRLAETLNDLLGC